MRFDGESYRIMFWHGFEVELCGVGRCLREIDSKELAACDYCGDSFMVRMPCSTSIASLMHSGGTSKRIV